MAITFLQQRKKQTYLVFILIVVVLITILVIWFGFFSNLEVIPKISVLEVPLVEIDWQVLESPQLEKLTPFEEISPLEEEMGRNNPFIPY